MQRGKKLWQYKRVSLYGLWLESRHDMINWTTPGTSHDPMAPRWRKAYLDSLSLRITIRCMLWVSEWLLRNDCSFVSLYSYFIYILSCVCMYVFVCVQIILEETWNKADSARDWRMGSGKGPINTPQPAAMDSDTGLLPEWNVNTTKPTKLNLFHSLFPKCHRVPLLGRFHLTLAIIK